MAMVAILMAAMTLVMTATVVAALPTLALAEGIKTIIIIPDMGSSCSTMLDAVIQCATIIAVIGVKNGMVISATSVVMTGTAGTMMVARGAIATMQGWACTAAPSLCANAMTLATNAWHVGLNHGEAGRATGVRRRKRQCASANLYKRHRGRQMARLICKREKEVSLCVLSLCVSVRPRVALSALSNIRLLSPRNLAVDP